MNSLEKYFSKYRKKIIGINHKIQTPYGKKKIIYADWIASGRLYSDIEKVMSKKFAPFVGNTHSESSETGQIMTLSYEKAREIIKEHVNANTNDVLFVSGNGMTGAINKFQRLLGIKIPEKLNGKKSCIRKCIPEEDRPVIFITHMEHHSNQISWLETVADVVIIKPKEDLTIDLNNLEGELVKYQNRKLKIGSFTACSNVTGTKTPYKEMAKLMHKHNGFCMVDFAASAPYDEINMHPDEDGAYLDGIYFSPHKFLGGPGTSGIMIVNKELLANNSPDIPGGGTVSWTTRWNEYRYVNSLEHREDGGTPAFLQTIRIALCIKLKEKIGAYNIQKREEELLNIAFNEMSKINDLNILLPQQKDRLGVISFYIKDIHHNLVVKLLNDRFGIQVRGGCSCAGTFGHYIFDYSKEESKKITDQIDSGNLFSKPGWVRLSLHPTMTNKELYTVINALKQVQENIKIWEKDYTFDNSCGEYFHNTTKRKETNDFADWFIFA